MTASKASTAPKQAAAHTPIYVGNLCTDEYTIRQWKAAAEERDAMRSRVSYLETSLRWRDDDVKEEMAKVDALRAQVKALRSALEMMRAGHAHTDWPSDQIAREICDAALKVSE